MVAVTSSNFEDFLRSECPVLVEFWAAWCGPCQMAIPILEEIVDESDVEIRVGRVDIDESRDLVERFQISDLPTFLLFDAGELKGRMMGLRPKPSFLKFLEIRR